MCSCSSYFTLCVIVFLFFFFNDTATTEIYTLSLHDALPISAIATIETALGSGPFASNTTFVNAVLLDVFFGVLSVSGLSLAAVIAERENAERERERVVSKQAAMEARLRAAEALRESEEERRLL